MNQLNLNFFPTIIPKHSVVSPQSARQYEAAFRQHYDSFSVADLGEPSRFGQDCYDATWILALALNNTLTGMVLYAVVSTTVIMINGS